jgi:ubiquinone/menaquinone biosynthesis C-methylase UbiE
MPVGQDGFVPEARYDGLAEWYDDWAGSFIGPFAELLAVRVEEFARPGETVIDVGCGTGLHFGALQALGLHVIGVDISADQLRLAKEGSALLVRADATAMPMRDKAIDTAVAAFVHRDIDDFERAVTEVSRVLRPGGRFAYVGTHPCFVAPFINRTTERDIGTIEVRSGYGDMRRRFDSAAPSRLTRRAGSRNLPLAAFLQSFIGAGLRIENFLELDTEARPWVAHSEDHTVLPWNILVVATKP